MDCFAVFESPLGKLVLESSGQALTGLRFAGEEAVREQENEVLPAAKLWLEDYFRGICRPVDFPVEPAGTPFRKLIWQLLLQIPWGETVTYGDLARQAAEQMGKETMSAQAVGQALGCNPIGILIPCHRVVGAGGKITGYAWGIEKKIWLLEHEQRYMGKKE